MSDSATPAAISISETSAPSANHAPRPRVLHIYKDYFPPVIGGVEATINILAEGCQDDYQTSVLVNSGSREASEEIINNVRVVRVPEFGRVASAPVSPAFVLKLAEEADKADILHFHHPNPTGDLARYIAKPKAPAVMTYHSDVVRQKWAMGVYGPLQNWQMSHCEVIMPTSPNYLESSKWLRRHRDRCTVVPLGIRMDELAETENVRQQAEHIKKRFNGEKLTLFVGRLRYYKGLQFLLNAADQFPGQILIAGTGPAGNELQEQAVRLGIKDRVHFLGDVSSEEKIALYYAADVFCMPSHLRSEAFGLSQLEAMACGIPVVCCNIPSGVPFVNRDGISGLVTPVTDSRALGQALNRILADDALREKLAAGARHRAHSEFTAEEMCRRVKSVYSEVLRKK